MRVSQINTRPVRIQPELPNLLRIDQLHQEAVIDEGDMLAIGRVTGIMQKSQSDGAHFQNREAKDVPGAVHRE